MAASGVLGTTITMTQEERVGTLPCHMPHLLQFLRQYHQNLKNIFPKKAKGPSIKNTSDRNARLHHTNLTSGVFCDLLLLLITQYCYCHSKVQVHFWGKIKRSYIRKYNDNTIKCILCKLIFIEKLLLNIEVELVEFLNFDIDIYAIFGKGVYTSWLQVMFVSNFVWVLVARSLVITFLQFLHSIINRDHVARTKLPELRRLAAIIILYINVNIGEL